MGTFLCQSGVAFTQFIFEALKFMVTANAKNYSKIRHSRKKAVIIKYEVTFQRKFWCNKITSFLPNGLASVLYVNLFVNLATGLHCIKQNFFGFLH